MNRDAGGAMDCTVESEQLLAPNVGGAAGVCAELENGLGPASPRPARIAVTVLSASRADARLLGSDGQLLTKLSVGSSDRPLARSSFRRLGKALAAQMAQKK